MNNIIKIITVLFLIGFSSIVVADTGVLAAPPDVNGDRFSSGGAGRLLDSNLLATFKGADTGWSPVYKVKRNHSPKHKTHVGYVRIYESGGYINIVTQGQFKLANGYKKDFVRSAKFRLAPGVLSERRQFGSVHIGIASDYSYGVNMTGAFFMQTLFTGEFVNIEWWGKGGGSGTYSGTMTWKK